MESKAVALLVLVVVAAALVPRHVRAAVVDNLGGLNVNKASQPRGIRLNNPMLIRKSASAWVGKLPQSSDAEYEEFASASDGIRAGAKLLRNYERLHGIRTVRGIISRWSPSSENPTEAYVRNVAGWIGKAPDALLNLQSREQLGDLVEAMIRQENGQQPYSRAEILLAVDRAFV